MVTAKDSSRASQCLAPGGWPEELLLEAVGGDDIGLRTGNGLGVYAVT